MIKFSWDMFDVWERLFATVNLLNGCTYRSKQAGACYWLDLEESASLTGVLNIVLQDNAVLHIAYNLLYIHLLRRSKSIVFSNYGFSPSSETC